MSNQRKILRVLQFISYLEQKPPKAVQHLAELLETTDRTVYRYLDLLRECGFDLQKDKFNRFFLQTDQHAGIRFTSEEAAFLKQLVLTAGKHNKLKDAVLSKIYLASDLQISAAHLVNAKNGLIVERLAQAMANKEQVILKRYHSINSESISDRLVEPFGFTDNYHTVMAFEPSSGKNKTYHLDRITTVEFTNLHFAFETQHEQQIPDAFGFSYAGVKYPLELDLTLKQYLLLKNEYPLIGPFVKYHPKKDRYELRMEVNSLEPLGRMGMGIDAQSE